MEENFLQMVFAITKSVWTYEKTYRVIAIAIEKSKLPNKWNWLYFWDVWLFDPS